jgi:hypothetical protein
MDCLVAKFLAKKKLRFKKLEIGLWGMYGKGSVWTFTLLVFST